MSGDSGEAPAAYHCRIGACRQLPKTLILVPVLAIQITRRLQYQELFGRWLASWTMFLSPSPDGVSPQ
jgi:hypothetical protein